ncbi:hypothetical protein J6590_105255 [Homalodisca vitripennis]|nr:hypothetical protein J6590_105255 [Homalodisca vitripennis]
MIPILKEKKWGVKTAQIKIVSENLTVPIEQIYFCLMKDFSPYEKNHIIVLNLQNASLITLSNEIIVVMSNHSFIFSGGTNSLSSQDLYNLLNGFGQQQPQMTAAMYQQYLLAAAAHQPSTHQHVYNAALLYPQQYQQQQQQVLNTVSA